MSGLLQRFFVPRWQHPDPEIRRRAIARLDLARNEHRQALERLARDTDPGVCTAALARFDDPEALLALHADGAVSEELAQRLVGLLTARDGNLALDQRIILVERITDAALLAEICLRGDDQRLRLAALGGLNDEQALIRQACENSIAVVRHAATERVTSDAGLTRLIRDARRDRQVLRLARERLDRRRADTAETLAAQERREALLDKLQRHASAPWEPLYAGHFRHLVREWATLRDSPDAVQERRYQDACRHCRKVIDDHVARQPKRREDIDEAQAPPDAACEEKFEPPAHCAVTSARHEAAASAAREALQARQARFADELDELERLLAHGAVKDASHLHQRLRQAAKELDADVRRPHEPRLKQLGMRLAELRDWRSFVAGPKRDQLLLDIEALAEDTSLADTSLNRRHRQLIHEWKALGNAAASRERSTRFRAASERIHARLAAWHTRLDAERRGNLATRERLCEQLENLLAQPAKEADPDALREIRDRARDQWQRASPVPRDQSEALGRRFGNIRQALQALIDQRAREIAISKRTMIEQVQALLTERMPAARRVEQVKTLQQRWRKLGRAPKGEEQALWHEFRGLCDRAFATLQAERADRVQRDQERLDAMQALVDRLDAWQPVDSSDETMLSAAIAEATVLEPLPDGRRTEGLRRRWSGIVRARRERLECLAVVAEIERWRRMQPLLHAHLDADAEHLASKEAREIALPEGLELTADMYGAHLHRNAERQRSAPAAEVEERLARVRVHLSLLAVGHVSQHDDPLRLAIQVERLNENLGRTLSRAEEVHGVLRELLAIDPVAPSLWRREAGELDRLLTHLARLPAP